MIVKTPSQNKSLEDMRKFIETHLPAYYASLRKEPLNKTVKLVPNHYRVSKPDVEYHLRITVDEGAGSEELDHIINEHSFLNAYKHMWAKMKPLIVERAAKENPSVGEKLKVTLSAVWEGLVGLAHRTGVGPPGVTLDLAKSAATSCVTGGLA